MGSDEQDRLLDEALRTYIAEPRPGLSGRVLARMRPRPGFARWLWAIPALACLVLAVLYRGPEVEPPPRPVAAHAAPAPPLAEPVPRVPAGPTELPKLDVFPERLPLTAEERALVSLAAMAPEQTVEALADRGLEPIVIQAIKIEPLNIDDGTE